MREIVIDGRAVNDASEAFVICEIGNNHCGDLSLCKEMIKVAKDCGASAVKLQKRDNESLYTRAMFDRPYENSNSYGATYGEHRQALELRMDAYVELQRYCGELEIVFFATAFDFRSADQLAELGVPAYKVASGDLKSIPLLRHIARKGKPMIVSTGGGTLEDIDRAHHAITEINPQLALLQCTAGYPPKYEELNIRVIRTLRDRFPNTVVGFSSHDNGVAMPLIAYVLGARIIEKHFTLDHTMRGTDHSFSLEPTGFRKMVRDIRRAPIAMGDGVKVVYECERQPVAKMGKKLVAARDLPAGHLLAEGDLALKSPADGLSAQHWDEVLGRRLTVALKAESDVSLQVLASQ